MLNITINQSSNIDFITIIASVIGALIAGFFSWFATKQAHENNQKLKEPATEPVEMVLGGEEKSSKTDNTQGGADKKNFKKRHKGKFFNKNNKK